MIKIKNKILNFDRLTIIIIITILFFTNITVSSNDLLEEEYNNYSLSDDCDDVCDDDSDDDDPTINSKPIAYIDFIDPNPAVLSENVFFSGYGEDSDGSIIEYIWTSNIYGELDILPSFHTNLLTPGMHKISFFVQDDKEAWSDPAIAYLEIVENEPPEIPIISGEVNPKIGNKYEYKFISTDPNEDDIYYYIDWGDGNFDEWIGSYRSDEEVIIDHLWNEKGTYTIKAKAKDVYNDESEWGNLKVIMSKSLNYNYLQFLRFIKNHPDLFKLFINFYLKF
jgi:hypothetical protein